jgi:hypothetical protein
MSSWDGRLACSLNLPRRLSMSRGEDDSSLSVACVSGTPLAPESEKRSERCPRRALTPSWCVRSLSHWIPGQRCLSLAPVLRNPLEATALAISLLHQLTHRCIEMTRTYPNTVTPILTPQRHGYIVNLALYSTSLSRPELDISAFWLRLGTAVSKPQRHEFAPVSDWENAVSISISSFVQTLVSLFQPALACSSCIINAKSPPRQPDLIFQTTPSSLHLPLLARDQHHLCLLHLCTEHYYLQPIHLTSVIVSRLCFLHLPSGIPESRSVHRPQIQDFPVRLHRLAFLSLISQSTKKLW